MKKLVSGLLAATCIATMSVGVMAADISAVKGPDYEWTLNNGTYSVQVDGLTKGNRYGLLAIKADAVLATVSDTDIMYIDQATATGESGTITFNGSGNGFLPKDPLALDAAGYKLYIGGYEDGSATQIGVLAAPQSVHAESVAITPATLTLLLQEGKEVKGQLTATMTPSDAVDTITWTVTAGSDYVSVDAEGVVTAKAKGEATITATTSNGKTATCTVTVTDGIPGDMDGSGVLNTDDAIHLGFHVAFKNIDATLYPISLDGDVNSDGVLNTDDAIYLGFHIAFKNIDPTLYPLYPSNN